MTTSKEIEEKYGKLIDETIESNTVTVEDNSNEDHLHSQVVCQVYATPEEQAAAKK